MAKITKKGTVKMSQDELFNMCYSFYKEGDIDSRRNVACLSAFKDEFERVTGKIEK